MKNEFFFWLATALAGLLFELGHPGLFFFLSFSLGAIGAALASLWISQFLLQSLVFLCTTVVACIALNKWCKVTQADAQHTNVYALQGKRGRVVVAITADTPGHVRVNGEIWLARSSDSSSYAVDALVEVVTMRGNHLVVKGVSEPNN